MNRRAILNSNAMFRCLAVAIVATVTSSVAVQAQPYLMMPDSNAGNNRLVLFDPFDGSLVNPNAFGLAGGTPIHAILVAGEIWVSEQVGDRVSRWALDGTPLGQIGPAGLDNIRGMGLINNKVYVTNGGAGNGSPGANSVVMFDTLGNPAGSFLTTGLAPSPFAVLEHQGDLLVASSSGNSDVHRFDLSGNPIGVFHNSTSLNFAEQMHHALNGDVWVAGFSTNNIVRLDPNTGALITSFTASGARGVWQLGNGNLLWTNSAGAHVLDVNTGTSSQVYSGGGRFIDYLPEPSTGLAMLALGSMFIARRRR